MPLVSVIMPAWNAARFIEQAVRSVLAQSFDDLELVVVDDGSTDDTRARLDRLARAHAGRMRVDAHAARRGAAAARNTAFAACTGHYLLFADADDLQHPRRVERSLAAMSGEAQAEMVFTDCRLIDGSGKPLGRNKGYPAGFDSATALLHQLERNHLWSSLCMIRRTAWMGFDESLSHSEDYELFLRMLIGGRRLALVREVLVEYRVHGANNSAEHDRARQCARRILERLDYRALERRLLAQHAASSAHLAIAAALLGADRPAAALKQLEHVPALQEPAAAFRHAFVSGVAHYRLHRFVESRAHFLRALEQAPQEAAALNNAGVAIAAAGGELEEAARYFARALELRPDYNDALHNLHRTCESSPWLLTARPLREAFIHGARDTSASAAC